MMMKTKLDQKLAEVEDQSPDLLHTQLYLQMKEICHSGPNSQYSHQNAKEWLFNLENERKNKNQANSRLTVKMEAFKFERKICNEQYEFNQKVPEH